MNHLALNTSVYAAILQEIRRHAALCPDCQKSGMCDEIRDFISVPYVFTISARSLGMVGGTFNITGNKTP